MAGRHTLAQTEARVAEQLGNLNLDFQAMAVTANLFRAANTVRNQLERSVLAEAELSWTAFVVLWVTWIWEPIETREVAAECGISKATVTGVLKTLEGRGLITRTKSTDDGRLVLVSLTPAGKKLLEELFPQFNKAESQIVASIESGKQHAFAENLRLLADPRKEQ